MKIQIYRIISVMFFAALVAMPSLVAAHGGGCRKANLPQCCHMDNSTGTVHCH